MTPLEIEAFCRKRYNAENDDFWSSAEIMDLIYAAAMELSNETGCIENIVTATATASQREYPKPGNATSIVRVEYNGDKLQKISWREDDSMTASNTDTTSTGTPRFYTEFEDSIYLRPTPDSSTATLKIYSLNYPQAVTSSSVLDIPVRYHLLLCYYILSEMYEKSKDPTGSDRFWARWQQGIQGAKRLEKRRKRGDSFAHVLNEDALPGSLMGYN